MDQEAAKIGDRSVLSKRAAIWRLRTRTLEFGTHPLLMGILNVTPDSFSDGGRFLDPRAAIRQAEKLAADGADFIDIGGESTRPGSSPISEQEEMDRVLPVVEAVCKTVSAPISIDTSKAAVASGAVAAGAEIINDVTALRGDPEMMDVAVRSGAGICVMHMQGAPQTMQLNPHYEDVVAEVIQFLREARDQLISKGIAAPKICVDPGIGFGKTVEHNLALVQNGWRLHELGCPVLVGYSRKSFLKHFLDNQQTDLTAAGNDLACALARQSVQILRVHDVAAVRQAVVLHKDVSGPGSEPKMG